jgi:ABC-type polysaccharide/polyol phosphate export permease
VPWQFLTLSLTSSVNSLVVNQDLIKKVYFPRETIPLAAILNNVVSLGIGFATLLAVMAVLEGIGSIGIGLLWTPVVFSVQFALIVGLALLFSALNVRFRDFSYLIEVGLAFGFYATPIFYELPANLNPWLYRVYMLNPMAHLVIAYRQALLDNRFPDLVHLAWPGVVAMAFLALGVVVFRRFAPTFADYV